MTNLLSLIKLRKHLVDEKQKVLADLYRQIEIIENNKKQLEDRLSRERAVLEENGSIEMYAYFGRFSENINRNIEKLNLEKSNLEIRIQIAQDDVREAFANVKRIEIVQSERERRDRKDLNDKETREMDDIGIDGFRRKEEAEL